MSIATSRLPAGVANAALVGDYPSPGLGSVLAAGPSRHDDFILGPEEVIAGRYGDLFWEKVTIGAGAVLNPTPLVGAEEVGTLDMLTAAAVGAGFVYAQTAVKPYYRGPPVGSILTVKLRADTGSATNYEMWTGFADSTGRVAVANATQFLGIRSIGGNLFGVVKRGAGAGNESTINFGLDAEGQYREVGLEIVGTPAAPAAQFFVLNEVSAARGIWSRRNANSIRIATNWPTVPLSAIALGFVTTMAATRAPSIDYWSLGGRTARG